MTISEKERIQYSINEPRRTDSFENLHSTIRFPSDEQIKAVKERRAVFLVPNVQEVIQIATQWREEIAKDCGETKATAMQAFDDLLGQVFPALTANANVTDIQRASYALEEPIIRLAQTERCNGGQLSIVRRNLHSKNS